VRKAPGRLDQKAFESRLTIGAVGPEISEVPSLRQNQRAIDFGIYSTLERDGSPGAVCAFENTKRLAATERKIQVECRDVFRSQIGAFACGDRRKRYRRVDVVEGQQRYIDGQQHRCDADPLRDIRAEYDGIAVTYRRQESAELVDRPVEHELAEGRVLEVPIFRIPRLIPFVENNVVAAPGQRLQQRPVGRRMTVPP